VDAERFGDLGSGLAFARKARNLFCGRFATEADGGETPHFASGFHKYEAATRVRKNMKSCRFYFSTRRF
jgi:hypothetical protein